jgi:transcriptional regulator with XRE-family HTH domain
LQLKRKQAGKRKAKHGPNVKIARICKNMTQDNLAFKMEMSQNKISVLELQDEIDDEALNKLAAALEVPVYFLRDFVPEEAMKSYHVYDNEMSMTHGDNSKGDVMGQKIVEKEENIYYPLDKVTELYERLLKEKEQQIKELKAKLQK